jgi:DNA-binding response OmpR family regulator/HPt (histidine-containing phosphotransfer) domain-containing protein
MSEQEQLLRTIAEIWQRNRGRMHERVRNLEAAARAAINNSLTHEQLENARHEAHRIAGSAGTFGYVTASATARRLEELLAHPLARAAAGGSPSLDAGEVRDMSQLVLALSDELRQPPPALRGAMDTTALQPVILIMHPGLFSEDIVDTLRRRNWTVLTADSPQQGRQLLAMHAEISTVLYGLCFPPATLDDRALVSEAAARCDVVVVTDNDDLRFRVEVSAIGAARFMSAPVADDELLSVLDALRLERVPDATVMLVDDDPLMLTVVSELLRMSGLNVITCNDALKCIEELRRHGPDLLMLDVQMPGVNGIDLCRALRADPDWRYLPIIFFTARSEPEVLHSLLAAGADDCLVKPVMPKILLERIQRQLVVRRETPKVVEAPEAFDGVDVLVVEDDAVLADVLLHSLAEQGLKCRWLSDGAAASEYLLSGSQGRPRLVLLDLELPSVDGLTLLTRLSAQRLLKQMRVIVLSVHNAEHEIMHTLELGALDHVGKPANMQILMKKVRNALAI